MTDSGIQAAISGSFTVANAGLDTLTTPDKVKRKTMREPKWRQVGDDPDYRFSLANERTFLAWIRTALALLAGGALLEQFSTKLGPHAIVVVLAVTLGALAAVLSALAYFRWRANEIAMRHGKRLPGTFAISLIAAGVLLVAATITVLVMIF
jgi:putative membrane protein